MEEENFNNENNKLGITTICCKVLIVNRVHKKETNAIHDKWRKNSLKLSR